MAFLDSDEDLNNVIATKFPYMETTNSTISDINSTAGSANAGSNTQTTDQETPTSKQTKEFSFMKYKELKPQLTEQEITEEKSRTIQIIDIPLEMHTSTIRSHFLISEISPN